MSEDTNILFLNAVNDVKKLSKKPTDEELLKLYGLYKQSLFGDNNTQKPFFFDFKNNSKWNAWEKNRGKSRLKCKKEYFILVNELKNKYK